MADKLAKSALLKKGYRTYNDGSIYFVGFSVQDWKNIIECIKEENNELADNDQKIIDVNVNEEGDDSYGEIFVSFHY